MANNNGSRIVVGEAVSVTADIFWDCDDSSSFESREVLTEEDDNDELLDEEAHDKGSSNSSSSLLLLPLLLSVFRGRCFAVFVTVASSRIVVVIITIVRTSFHPTRFRFEIGWTMNLHNFIVAVVVVVGGGVDLAMHLETVASS